MGDWVSSKLSVTVGSKQKNPTSAGKQTNVIHPSIDHFTESITLARITIKPATFSISKPWHQQWHQLTTLSPGKQPQELAV
jgi:hypothetical protein